MPRVLSLLGLSLLITFGYAYPAHAESPTNEQRKDFHTKVAERNRLFKQLYQLREQAADQKLEQGEVPRTTLAQIDNIRNQIDLLQLELSKKSVKWGLALPKPPEPPKAGQQPEDQIDALFAGAREQVNFELQKRAKRFVRSINYDRFLRGVVNPD